MEPIQQNRRIENEDSKIADTLAGNINISMNDLTIEANELIVQELIGNYWRAAFLSWIILGGLIFLIFFFEDYGVSYLESIFGRDALDKVIWFRPLIAIFSVFLALEVLSVALAFRVGLWMICVNQVKNEPYNPNMIFSYFRSKYKLLFCWILVHSPLVIPLIVRMMVEGLGVSDMSIIIHIFDILGVSLFIFTITRYSCYRLLIIDKHKSSLDALNISYKITGKLYKNLFQSIQQKDFSEAFSMVRIIFFLTDSHPFILWMSWQPGRSAPFAFLLKCILYRELIGFSPPMNPSGHLRD